MAKWIYSDAWYPLHSGGEGGARSAPGEGAAAVGRRKESLDALTRLPLTPTLSRKGKGFWATG